MKIAVTSDWHIGCISFGVVGEDGVNSRLHDIRKSVLRSIMLAKEAGCCLYVMPGDVFHTNRPTEAERLIFFKLLVAFEEAQMPVHFITGNHDHNSQIGQKHALATFKQVTAGWQFVHIHDETEWVVHEKDGCRVALCYQPYKGADPDFSKMMEFGALDATGVVCHSHLEGAVVGAEPFEIKSNSVTKFSSLPVDYIIAGHFHKPQVLGERPFAFYPGSLMAVDFNERNDVKGMVILNVPERDYETCGIETRRLIQIDLDGSMSLEPQHLRDVGDAIVKVNLRLSEVDARRFNDKAIRETLTEAGAHSIASINVEVTKADNRRDPTIKLDDDLGDNFRRYVSLRRDSMKDPEEVERVGLEIIHAVHSGN